MQEQMMAQQQGMVPQQPMGMEAQMGGYAYGGLMENQYGMGGNLFADGGALDWINKNKRSIKNKEAVAKALWKYMQKHPEYKKYKGGNSSAYNSKTRSWDESKAYWDFSRAFNDLTTGLEARNGVRFNEWVSNGLSREDAFELSFGIRPSEKLATQRSVWDNNYKKYVTNQSQVNQVTSKPKTRPSAGYRGADGKLYSTLEEANAAGGNRQVSISNPTANKQPAGVNVTFKGLNGTKKTWEEESKGWNRNQNVNFTIDFTLLDVL